MIRNWDAEVKQPKTIPRQSQEANVAWLFLPYAATVFTKFGTTGNSKSPNPSGNSHLTHKISSLSLKHYFLYSLVQIDRCFKFHQIISAFWKSLCLAAHLLLSETTLFYIKEWKNFFLLLVSIKGEKVHLSSLLMPFFIAMSDLAHF